MESGVQKVGEAPAVTGAPVILFDGVCNLCSGLVNFVIRRDPGRIFRFASLQSAAGRRLLGSDDIDRDRLDTFVLVDGEKRLLRSDAALAVLMRLGPPWSFLGAFRLLPHGLRDALYRFVARNRYAWFGKKSECLVPTPDVRERFLDT